MMKSNGLVAMIAVAMLALAGPAMADDLLYDGSGSPIPGVFTAGNVGAWDLDTEFGTSGDSPGILTGTGPGGYTNGFRRDFDTTGDGIADNNDNPLLFSRGWRVEWRARTANENEPAPNASANGQAFAVADDSHQVRVGFDADGTIGGGSVFLQVPGTGSLFTSPTASGIDLTQFHVYEMTREANDATIGLSVDGTQVTSITPSQACALPQCDAGNLNNFLLRNNTLWAYDYINFWAPEPGSLALLALGGLTILRRRRHA